MSGHVDFAELRARLDVRDVAEGEGLTRRGRDYDCPACGRRLKCRSRDGEAGYCVACEWCGDALDLIGLTRGVDRREALRIACDLAGLEADGKPRPGDVWRPPPRRPEPAPEPLAEAELEARMRAVRLAAHHYMILLGLAHELDEQLPRDDRDEDGAGGDGAGRRDEWPSPREHVGYLASCGGYRPAATVEAQREVALGYLRERMGAAWGDAREILAELVGLCPALDSGLRAYLHIMGGAALVAAGERAGLWRWDGAERFAGCLVYFWTDSGGRVVYLTGRAVPALQGACRRRYSDKGEPIKGEALPVFNPDRRGDRLGVPPPSAPFGAHLALRREGPIVIVEGELDAVHELVAGPAVATGGTGRMGSPRGVEVLQRVLEGRAAIVAFDVEDNAIKQAQTDRRGRELAAAIGARWVAGGKAA